MKKLLLPSMLTLMLMPTILHATEFKFAKERPQGFQAEQEEWWGLLKNRDASRWTYKRGDETWIVKGSSICTYKGNYFGYVDDVAPNSVKVYWKGSVLNEQDGFFFGNLSYSAMNKHILGQVEFDFKKLNEVTWISRDEVNICKHGS